MQVFSCSSDIVHEAGMMCTRSAAELQSLDRRPWTKNCIINLSMYGLVVNMARHCTCVQYFPSPSAWEILLHTRAISRHIER